MSGWDDTVDGVDRIGSKLAKGFQKAISGIDIDNPDPKPFEEAVNKGNAKYSSDLQKSSADKTLGDARKFKYGDTI